jgi:glycosyltransferase involved in cell wall biosynthesis
VRILIDSSPLLLRSAGVKSYTWHWLRHLRRLAPPGVISAFPFLGKADGALDHEHSILGKWATWPRLGALAFLNLPGNPAMDAVCRGYDLFHASNMVRVPPRNVRLTATLYDMTCRLMPQLHTSGNLSADLSFTRSVISRASGLIAISENTRLDAARLLGIPAEKIDVIYPGIDERFFTAAPLVRRRPYALFLGTIEPRKNVDTLLDAWHELPASLRDEFDLVVAGPAGWKSETTLARLRFNADNVHYLGYVPESEIPSLTAGASAFAYVSLYEGFGFPVAQAMAAGVPVVTSNTSCLPEVAGDAALCVDPRSPAEVGNALNRVLSDAAVRSTLGPAGRTRARQYRWEECARRSLAFFERVIGS